MSLVTRPNRILAQQKYFQANANTLLFLRGPRDKLFVYGTFLVLGTGLAGTLVGLSNLVRGNK
ncbi:hypothetical protein BDB01DRAFT_760626 [Pilobolus umbonatus]|nr:hypothetical protein BDB01DRAFT_760626 [Pilobolus umbonatus]